jgi:hypothetical protein
MDVKRILHDLLHSSVDCLAFDVSEFGRLNFAVDNVFAVLHGEVDGIARVGGLAALSNVEQRQVASRIARPADGHASIRTGRAKMPR